MTWHKAIDIDQLPDGRVTTVAIGTTTLAVSHVDGRFGAIDNRCPHQGGPLGEGTIEPGVEDSCWLRCPWHGYDYDPIIEARIPAHNIVAERTVDVRRAYSLPGPVCQG